eukprot:gene12457-13745_t
MAASANVVEEDFIFGDDIDVLVAFLEDDLFDPNSELLKPFLAVDEELKTGEACKECGKMYKTRGGLTRHVNSKHKKHAENAMKIHPLELKAILAEASLKLSNDQCFPEELRSHFKGFNVSLADSIEIREKFAAVFDKFSGNGEKFYSNFYEVIALGEVTHVGTLCQQDTSLLLTEVANICLGKLAGCPSETTTSQIKKKFTEKELNSLEYLSDDCFHKVYMSTRNSKKWNSIAAKTDVAQKLVDLKNRGGLWKVNRNAVAIFMEVETKFMAVSAQSLKNIDASSIFISALKDPYVKSHISSIVSAATLDIENEIAINVFKTLIHLYVRVRSHSHAKDIKEKHKAMKKLSKKNSLRTEIKRAIVSTNLGHQVELM